MRQTSAFLEQTMEEFGVCKKLGVSKRWDAADGQEIGSSRNVQYETNFEILERKYMSQPREILTGIKRL